MLTMAKDSPLDLATGSPAGFRGVFRTDAAARAVYAEAAGIAQIIPRAVAVPVDADDVVHLVRWAAMHGEPLVPRGSGSSMAGGAIGDGVIVDLSGLRWIQTVDTQSRTVRCGAGALRDEIDTAARASGFVFPVDPSSGAFCTVGGMASTNAAGARSLKHGATRRWVQSLDCVFADGTRAEVRRGEPPPNVEVVRRLLAMMDELRDAERRAPSRHVGVRKESSGYALADYAGSGELVDLLVGSEGTLVVIVGLELRLAPVPGATASVLGAFASLDDAVAGAGEAVNAGASACELLDRTFLDVARGGGADVPVPADTEAVLLAEVEGVDASECACAAAILERAFRTAGAVAVIVALDDAAEHALWTLRHAASPILARLDPRLRSMQFIEDGCVSPQRLAEYVRGVREALMRHDTRGVIFGHAGDAHVHVNPLVDVSRPDWRARVDALLADVTALVARLGGTAAGEHGDGRLRAPLFPELWPAESIERFTAVKTAFDSQGIMNPGAIVATPGARSVDRVKYDPELEPLPAAARAALARVEDERAYATGRLALLTDTSARLDGPRGAP